MRLMITTPTEVVVERDDVTHVRAEDETGAFGILPGHADFLTVLAVSVLTWRERDSGEGHVAVRGGVLRVDHNLVEVVTPEAVEGVGLRVLENKVLSKFRADAEAEKVERSATTRLQLAAIRHIRRYLNPEAGPGLSADVPRAGRGGDRSPGSGLE
jgi:F-type H+-transporting ATPase subunit epsilon